MQCVHIHLSDVLVYDLARSVAQYRRFGYFNCPHQAALQYQKLPQKNFFFGAFRGSSLLLPPQNPLSVHMFHSDLNWPNKESTPGSAYGPKRKKKKKIISFCNCSPPPILHYTAHRKKGVAQNPEKYEEMPRIEYFKLGK